MSACIRVLIVEGKGSVPRPAGVSMLVFADRIEGTIGGGALAPVLFGRLGDITGVPSAVMLLAATLLLTLPLAWWVQRGLARE